MRRFVFILFAAVLTLIATGCWEKSANPKTTGPLYRMHFAGMESILKGTNATVFQKVWKMPVSAELREQTLQKLARVPFEFWKTKLPAGTTDEGGLIKPLLDDLVQNECIIEVDGPVQNPETAVAVRVNAERAGAWEKNLTKLVQTWKLGEPAKLANGKGWEVTGAKAGERVRFERAGDWVLFGFGTLKLDLMGKWASAAEKGPPVAALSGKLLEVDADLPNLRGWFPILSEYPLPPITLSIAGSGPNLKTELLLRYHGKLSASLEPWRVPYGIVNDPLVSFTVARGIEPFLKEFNSVQRLGLNPLPNQFCMWGQEHKFPFSYLTIPVRNATNEVNQIARTAPKVLEESLPGHMGEILWISNRAVVLWKDIPFLAPKISPFKDKSGDYIYAELFPRPPITNPPPAELFAQFKDKSNLLYYDWEMTRERLPHANQIFDMKDILTFRLLPPTNSVAQKWISTIGTNLADCITEITLASPNELKLVRKSQVGLTGFELAALAQWLESARFPLEYELRPMIKNRPGAVQTGNTNNASRPRSPRPSVPASPPKK